MTNYICATCGVQHAASDAPPEHCPICEDERQYIGHNGQRCTSIPELQKDRHNRIENVSLNLTGIGKSIYEAITGRDYIVIQGLVLVVATIYVVVNLVVDVSYAFLDPRIRLG